MIGSLFGLAPTQAVRISVSSNDGPAISGNTIKAESELGFVQVKIFDAGTGEGADRLLKIAPGAAFSADLKYEDFKEQRQPEARGDRLHQPRAVARRIL
jgi:hypothetical protein